jgi:hypothetical protein
MPLLTELGIELVADYKYAAPMVLIFKRLNFFTHF